MMRKANAVVRPLDPAHPYRLIVEASFARLLLADPATTDQARARYRAAARGTLIRVASYGDFAADAQTELKRYRPVFIGEVKAAWRLAGAHMR